MASRPVRPDRKLCIPTFGAVLPNLIVESVLDPTRPNQLQLHTWNGREATTVPTFSHLGHTYVPAPMPTGLAGAVRFPSESKPFKSAQELTSSMLEFLTGYAHLLPDAAAVLVAFALSSFFSDCVPIAPILYLLGPHHEARLVLRLLGLLCRRSALLGDVDIAALAMLPSGLDATLLISQRSLGRQVKRILLASNDRHFRIARGNGQLYAYGAKAFSADARFGNGAGVQVSLLPTPQALPALTDAQEKTLADDLQAKLLRYRMVNYPRVRDARIETQDFVPTMRDEARSWLAPICDCPDLARSVTKYLLRQSHEAEGARFSDDHCVAAEAALFYCHKANTDHFFVGDVAETSNKILQGRHEDREVTNKRAGSLLDRLGIHGRRVTKGYKIVLTDSVRERIHQVARDYQVLSAQDGIARCRHCPTRTLKERQR